MPMIAGSRRIPLTFHGILGYSAFLLMATDLVLIWRRYQLHGDESLPARLHHYSLAAYSWWVLAFVAGMILALTVKYAVHVLLETGAPTIAVSTAMQVRTHRRKG